MTKPSDASMKRAHEELERWYASGKGYYHPESLAALLDAVRDEALEEAIEVLRPQVGSTLLVHDLDDVAALKAKP